MNDSDRVTPRRALEEGRQGASLWTLNPGDFRDVPGLELYEPD